MLENFFSRYSDKIHELKEFLPFAESEKTDFFSRINSDIKNQILTEAKKSAEKIEKNGWPQLKPSAFLEFTKTGNRENYENLYFNFRNLLTLQSLAECIENQGKYLENILDGIFLLCGHTAWQLPAHNSYIRDTPQLNFPDPSRPILDLFACETGAQIAVIYYLLKNQFEKISPFICPQIEKTLNERIIEPYLSSHFWWMGNEDEAMCNWTRWCTQNVLLTAFLTPQTFETRKKILQKSFYSLDCFLKDYGDDGCCSEGAEYYRHAALCLFNCIDIINTAAGGILSESFKSPKIKNIAEFILNMNVPHTKYYFNFSDCSPLAGLCGAREFLFGKSVSSDELCSFAAEHWSISSAEQKLLFCTSSSLKQANIYYLLQGIFYDDEINSFAKNQSEKSEKEIPEKNIWYKSTGVFIVHKKNFCLAVKAGCNADSHNHNDTGSLTLYKNGKPFLIDLGVETYSQKTFSPQRYEIWTMQSAWHNIPTINSFMQKDGKEFSAANVEVFKDKIKMNLEKAYPQEAGLKFYTRFVEARENSIYLCDEYEVQDEKKDDVVLSLIFSQKPELFKNKLSFGNFAEIIFDKIYPVKIEEVKIEDTRLKTAWPDFIYRAQIKFSKKIEIQFL